MRNQVPDAPLCLTTRGLATRWACSTTKVRSMLHTGELPCIRLGTMLRIPITAVIAFEARCQESPTPPVSAALRAAAAELSPTSAMIALRVARLTQRFRQQ